MSTTTLTPLKRLGHVAVRVTDIPTALAFYKSLGMEVAWEDHDWAYVKAGADGLALLGPAYTHAGAHFGFILHERAELAAHFAALKASGAACSPLLDHRDGTSSFYAKDPDGNLLEFLYEPVIG
ncbi:VOC family protein [Anthocerotibacter panamensis]|uniref:VOC family protein n=1 Tax=Anthocerotibacter panamensis TaxID=2857077 RepID=UPI001C407A4E|nr:VOC family protein [Anthocerotibacter panamensis]